MRWAFAILALIFLASAVHASWVHWSDQMWISAGMAVLMIAVALRLSRQDQ